MKYCHYLFVALGITSAAILASCQDEDFGYTADQIAYRTNFEKMYGSVKDIPTWDFSSYNLRQMGLAGGPSMQKSSATRSAKSKDWNTGGSCTVSGASSANEITKSVTGYYSVEQNTLTWLNKYLKEGKDNRALGTSFKLVKPENNKDFLIIPVYQGHSGMTWDLHLVAENNSSVLKDYKIWSHSENIKYTQDFNVDGGVEFFYNTTDDSSNGSDISEWAEGGVVKEIMLKRAFCNDDENNPSVADNATLSLELPAGGYVDAYLTNKDENKRGEYQYRWRIFADNRENSSSKRFDFKLTNIIEQSWFPTDNLWNLVLRVDYYNDKCSFDTFKDNRVRIFVKYNRSSEVNLTSMDCGSSTQNFINRHTIDRKNVKSQPIRIDCSKIKDDFYFYLDVTRGDEYVTGDNDQAVTGAHQSSDDGMMLALLDNSTTEKLVTSSSDLATSLNSIIDMTGVSSCEYFVIGCEDANLKDSDWDINDVVFLVVGLDKAPKIKELIKKRYMIEDLGGTFDFDFNDIVVDVTQEKLKNVSDGTYSTAFGTDGARQYATLKHLCGTIPFKIKIGNTVIGQTSTNSEGRYAGNNGGCSEGEYGYDPTNDSNYAPLMNAEVTGWKPNENNITVTTWPTQAGWTDPGTGGYVGIYPDGVSFSFPENKQYPYIIACDQTVGWMPELTSVPQSWFKTWPQQYYDYNDITPPTPSNPGSGFTVDKTEGVTEVSSVDGTKFTITITPADGDNNKYPYINFNQNSQVSEIYFKVPANSAFEGYIGGWDNSAQKWYSQDAVKIVNNTTSVKCYKVALNDNVKSVSNTESFKLDLAKVEGNCSFDPSSDKPKVEIYLKQ